MIIDGFLRRLIRDYSAARQILPIKKWIIQARKVGMRFYRARLIYEPFYRLQIDRSTECLGQHVGDAAQG